MLKFLRKYQKMMLVVFCAALMVAFLVPQAVQQFAPNPATKTMATTYGTREIKRTDLLRTADQIRILRRLGIEPFVGLTLLPSTGNELDDAMIWTLIQHAAEHNGLSASQQEAFNLMASSLDAADMDALEEKAVAMGVNAPYLMALGKQYLMAEQYRQLISGIEYSNPMDEETTTGSPGLRRVFAISNAIEGINEIAQQFQQMGLSPQQAVNLASQSVLGEQGYLDKITGHMRTSGDEMRYALQREFAELDITVAVLDIEDLVKATDVDDAYVQGIFDRYADDAPGTGEPYGLGYREPNKVKLEALRIPIEQAREVVAKEITPEDIRTMWDAHREQFRVAELATDTEEDQAAAPQPAKLTPELRDEIRVILTQQRAEQKVVEIAQAVRQRLNEDARGLDRDGPFKVLPDDFVPTSLVELTAEIEQEHGIVPEVIQIQTWTAPQGIVESAQFTQAWISQTPTSTVRMPHPQFGFLSEQQVPEAVLGGKAGLFASLVPELSDLGARRIMTLGEYVNYAKPFIDPESDAARAALQPQLPGAILSDITRSTYVFRISAARPSQPATELGPIAEQVTQDAKRVKAYERLIAEKDALVEKAATQGITALLDEADNIRTLSGLTRRATRQPRANPIDGLGSTLPIVQKAFGRSDELLLGNGLDAAQGTARMFAVELPGDYKLAVVRLDKYRPLTLADFQERAEGPTAITLASQLMMPDQPEPALSMEALMRYTDFKWSEGSGPENLQSEGEAGAAEDADESSDEDDA